MDVSREPVASSMRLLMPLMLVTLALAGCLGDEADPVAAASASDLDAAAALQAATRGDEAPVGTKLVTQTAEGGALVDTNVPLGRSAILPGEAPRIRVPADYLAATATVTLEAAHSHGPFVLEFRNGEKVLRADPVPESGTVLRLEAGDEQVLFANAIRLIPSSEGAAAVDFAFRVELVFLVPDAA